jgi:RHS repeat-associated protein
MVAGKNRVALCRQKRSASHVGALNRRSFCALSCLVAGVVAFGLLLTPASSVAVCVGDCDNNKKVIVDELVKGATIALGEAALDACPQFDRNDDRVVTVDELVVAVNNALHGCPVEATPTPTPPRATDTPGGPPTPTPSNPPGLSITFHPMTGPPGQQVTISGPGLATTTEVAFNGTDANFTVGSGDSVTAVVPASATTGPVRVTTSQGTVTSDTVFAVLNPSTFTLRAGPSAASVIQGQSTTYTVTLDSSDGFLQLTTLSLSGLPPGITATMTPPQITAGQTALLTVSAPPNQPTGTSSFTVSAAATVLGVPELVSATASLTVQPLTTSFLGRTVVDDTTQTSLAGVTIKFLGQDGAGRPTGCSGQTVSDVAGNFAFTNLPDQCTGSQLISYDGSTATSPPGRYAGVNLIYTIIAHQVVVSPVLVHLPRIDDRETVMVKQNAGTDQTFTFSTIPFLTVTVYAGTIFTLSDGTHPDPFPLTAVEVPIDRLPEEFSPQAQNPSSILGFIVAFQPANAAASQPVAVTFPNTFNTAPGTYVQLYTLDPTRGEMVPYGSATVSQDGTQIVPNGDPAHPGHQYGLVHFDWHGPTTPSPNQTNTSPQNTTTPNNDNGTPQNQPPDNSNCTPVCDQPDPVGEPVDVSSGLEVVTATDVALPGLRGGVFIQRTYRTGTNNPGPFGIGTGHNFGYQLGVTGAGLINLVMPDGNQFPFNQQPDGTFVNSTNPSLRGAVLRNPASGVFDLRWKEGTTYEFQRMNLLTVLTSISDRNGNVTTITRGSNPLEIAQIVDPVGRALVFQYDGSSRITSITDPLGRVVQYAYNAQGTLATVTDAAGEVTRYDYDAQDRLTKVTDARGVVVAQNVYDENGRVSRQTLADGGVYHFSYELLNPLAPAVSPVLRTIVTDPIGHVTTYHFNALGFVLDITDATGQTRFFQRAPGTNLVLSVTGTASCAACGGSVTFRRSFTYDANGNVLSSTDALGNTLTFTYEPAFNQLTSVTDPLGQVITIDHDDRGNAIRVTDPSGTRTADFDAVGQLTRLTNPLGESVTFSYDRFGNITGLTDALGATTSAAYDAVSRETRVTDSLGRTTTTSYDAVDRVTAVTDAQQNTTSYTYDAVGNPLTVTDPLGNTTAYTWEPVGQLASLTTALGKTETYAYDAAGNVVEFVDRRGQATHYAYDALNRLVTETFQDGSTVTRSYDANGQLIEADDSVSGMFTFAYDVAGRLIGSAGPFGAVRYTYDPDRRVTSRTVVGQAPVQYAYDGAGNLIEAATQGAGVDLTYDARNAIVGLSRANGVTSSYSYDPVGRLLSLVHAKAGGTLSSQAYTYDTEGFRTSATNTGIQSLITAAASNQFDANNRLVHGNATAYTYDDAGDLTSATGPDGTTTYAWDARGQLQSIVAPDGQRTDLFYDFAGRLIAQTDSGPRLNRTRNFVLDDANNVALIEDDGDPISVLDGRILDQHFAIIHGSGAVEYPLVDAGNNTVATVDGSGNIVDTFAYEPFGLTATSGSVFPFQFAGRVPINGTIYSYRARYYDTALGRFLSEDPLGFTDSDANLYAVRDPVNLTDPLGLSPACGSVGKVSQITNTGNGGSPRLEFRHGDNGPWYTAYVGQDVFVDDQFRTDANSAATLDYTVGGRIGVNRSAAIQIVNEHLAKTIDNVTPQKPLNIRLNEMWARFNHDKLRENRAKIEIQSEGGLMGIRG